MKIRNNGSRIFLTELMFSILFFIIIASICVQCFAQGYVMSKQADQLTQAVNLASNTCEMFLATDDFPDETKVYYDEDWAQVNDSDNASYMVDSVVTEKVGSTSYLQELSVYVISVEDDEEIYSLSVEKGTPLED